MSTLYIKRRLNNGLSHATKSIMLENIPPKNINWTINHNSSLKNIFLIFFNKKYTPYGYVYLSNKHGTNLMSTYSMILKTLTCIIIMSLCSISEKAIPGATK